jgi:hypothetical protein
VQQSDKYLAEVEMMLEPGPSPAIDETKPSQMADIIKSKACFAIGFQLKMPGPKKNPCRQFQNVWQFSSHSAEITAREIGGQVAFADPPGRGPDGQLAACRRHVQNSFKIREAQ